MSMLVPPQMMNTMAPHVDAGRPGLADRRVLRRPGPPLHAPGLLATGVPTGPRTRTPPATRCTSTTCGSTEGLTHRYPTKVLAELLPTCPQYCGHCTRMDLVGNSTAGDRQAEVRRQAQRPARRHARLPAPYARRARRRGLRRRRGEHAVAAPRGVPRPQLLEIENIRDIRLATKALMGLPQHWLQPDVVEGMTRVGTIAARARRLDRDPHPRQPRQLGDPAGRRGDPDDARHRHPRRPQPGRDPATASTPTRTRCSTSASRCSMARRSCPTTSTCAT